jgi:hypothetical protein
VLCNVAAFGWHAQGPPQGVVHGIKRFHLDHALRRLGRATQNLTAMPNIVIPAAGSTTDDHRELIQRALDAVAAAGGGEVHVPDGVHMIGPLPENQIPQQAGAWSLRLADNVHLRLGAGATLVRRFQGGGINATIRNRDPDRGNKNIRVSGGIIKSHGTENSGKHLGFANVDGLAVRDMRFEGVRGDWNIAIADCTDVTVSGVVMNSGAEIGEDGLHFVGGRRIVVTNCILHSGDDALSLTQEAGGNSRELLDVVVSNCFLWSKKANALRIWVNGDAAHAIRRVRISNIVAKTGTEAAPSGIGITIQDTAGKKRISDVDLDGFTLDARHNNGEVAVIDGVERVRLNRVIFLQPATRVAIDSSDDVELVDCIVDAPRTEAAQCLLVGAKGPCKNLRIRGGAYRGATHHAIILGGEHAVTGFELANVQISKAKLTGLVLGNASGGVITGNAIVDNATFGVDEAEACHENSILGNRLRGNGEGPMRLAGQRSIAAGNDPNRRG